MTVDGRTITIPSRQLNNRQHREADATGVIQPPGPDTSLNVGGKLSTESQIFGADRAGRTQEQHSQAGQV